MNNNPKGTKNPKKPLIFYYAVMLLVLMMLNWLLFPSLLQRQVTEVGFRKSMWSGIRIPSILSVGSCVLS